MVGLNLFYAIGNMQQGIGNVNGQSQSSVNNSGERTIC